MREADMGHAFFNNRVSRPSPQQGAWELSSNGGVSGLRNGPTKTWIPRERWSSRRSCVALRGRKLTPSAAARGVEPERDLVGFLKFSWSAYSRARHL